MIYDGKIMSPILGWKRRKYSGPNPHRSHFHISFTTLGDKDSSYFDLEGGKNERPKKDVAKIAILEENERLAQLELAKKKAAAEAKLAALGLDADDLKALGLG